MREREREREKERDRETEKECKSKRGGDKIKKRLKRTKRKKRDQLRQHLLLFDVRKLSKGKSVFCLATAVEGLLSIHLCWFMTSS